MSDLINQLYPVGSIYLSLKDECSPATFIPTSEWERLPEGKALWTASSGLSITDNSVNKIDEGLPNITGEIAFGIPDGWLEVSRANGCFSKGYYESTSQRLSYTSAYNTYLSSVFNANSGATTKGIYRDDCTTVQPPSYKVYAWKRTK